MSCTVRAKERPAERTSALIKAATEASRGIVQSLAEADDKGDSAAESCPFVSASALALLPLLLPAMEWKDKVYRSEADRNVLLLRMRKVTEDGCRTMERGTIRTATVGVKDRARRQDGATSR